MRQLRPAGLAPGKNPAACAPPLLLVANKSDLSRRRGNGASKPLNPAAAVPEAWRDAVSAVVQTSARTGAGLDALKHAVLTLTDSPQLSSGAPALHPSRLYFRGRHCQERVAGCAEAGGGDDGRQPAAVLRCIVYD